MGKEEDRFMRILVFFDLPVTTKIEQRAATRFRNFLLKDGFFMVQYSVYSRICKGTESTDKHQKRIEIHLPEHGSIRVLQITDKQYSRMAILLGTEKKEEILGNDQLLLF